MTRRTNSKRPRQRTTAKSPEVRSAKRALQKSDLRQSHALPPPKTLTKSAAQYWGPIAELLASFGVTKSLDVFALQSLVETYSELVRAREEQDQLESLIQVTANKMGVRREVAPEVKLVNTLEKRLLSLMAVFGLTPADRSRLVAAVEAVANEWDE